MKVRFSDVLGNGVDDETLKSRFVVKIASSESGSVANAVTQGTSTYQIIRNADPGYHDLAFTLPALYNGVPDFLHTIQATMTRPGNSALVATRQVQAEPTQQGSFVNITKPPEFDSDGKRFEIVLPDKPMPLPSERQTVITVETSTDIETVSISFANNAATASLIAEVETELRHPVSVTNGSTTVAGLEKMLTGTVSTTMDSSTVTGSGTLFTTEVEVGDLIRIGSQDFIVITVNSNTQLTTVETADAGGSGLSLFLRSHFDQELSVGNTVKIGGTTYKVAVVNDSDTVTLEIPYAGSTTASLPAFRVDPNPISTGSRKLWKFLWSNMTPGSFTFTALAHPSSGPDVSATRNTLVVLRQVVTGDENDADDDNDGLSDVNETTPTALPATNPESWSNGQVHVYYAYGHSNPLSPDTDGDGLPDGLEVGWRTAANPPTDPAADTNGDGSPNFIGDLDPPFFNTLDNFGNVPDVDSQSQGGDRAKQVAGSATNPNDPDTDHDGIPDGLEDANRNGWTDGDGASLATTTAPSLGRNWPNGVMDPGETWLETSPLDPDSDKDGLSDGYGEDVDLNGKIAGDTDNDRVYDGGETWSETNPLKADTDGDGLPDGWEVRYGLDPLDNGTLNMRTGGAGNPDNGASGNPDGDDFETCEELVNGTDPTTPNTIVPPPPGIDRDRPAHAGRGRRGDQRAASSPIGALDDLIVLDEYDGAGANNQGADVYHGDDGFDSSRDLVAFYAHDGGDPDAGRRRQFLFPRRSPATSPAYAEEGNLDIYVVVDSGNPAIGEYALPDDVDTGTTMRWEAVVAGYSSTTGASMSIRTTPRTPPPSARRCAGFGSCSARPEYAGWIQERRTTAPTSTRWNFPSAARRCATRAGTAIRDPAQLPGLHHAGRHRQQTAPGAGDIGGRSDIRDTIYDDFLASDYYKDQSDIGGDKSVLNAWFSAAGQRAARVQRPRQARQGHLARARQPGDPAGQLVQTLINNAAGAGYYRPLDVHQAYERPARPSSYADPRLGVCSGRRPIRRPAPYRDGPAFNARLNTLDEERRDRPARQHLLRSLAAVLPDRLQRGQRRPRRHLSLLDLFRRMHSA